MRSWSWLRKNRLCRYLKLWKNNPVKTLAYTYWQDGDAWLGYIDEFPDYLTQGKSLADLKAHLIDLYRDISSGEIPCIRHHAELELA